MFGSAGRVAQLLMGRAAPMDGGAGRDRTGDLLNANQALSQLSYSPWLGIGDQGLGTRHAPQTPTPNPWPPSIYRGRLDAARRHMAWRAK